MIDVSIAIVANTILGAMVVAAITVSNNRRVARMRARERIARAEIAAIIQRLCDVDEIQAPSEVHPYRASMHMCPACGMPVPNGVEIKQPIKMPTAGPGRKIPR